MLDYWLAGWLGRIWLLVRPGLRDQLGDVFVACQNLARGDPVPAKLTWQTQEFAARVWFRFALAVLLPGFALIGISAVLSPGQGGREAAAVVLGILVCLMAVGLMQMAMLRYRADRTRRYLSETPIEAHEEPLPENVAGRPHQYDFWLMSSLAVLGFGVLLYAGTR